MIDFLFFLLALIAIHRIWHREDIFAWPVTALRSAGSLTKPLWCSACSPVWLGLALALAWPLLPPWVVWPLAAYPFVRFAAFAYTADWRGMLPDRREHLKQALDAAVARKHGPPAPATTTTTECATCGTDAQALAAKIAPATAPASVRAAATAEVSLAVPLDAPEETLRGAVVLAISLQHLGATTRLLGIGSTPTSPTPAVLAEERLRQVAKAAGMGDNDVVMVAGERSFHLADAVVLAGPRAGALQWEAAMHGVVLLAEPGHASVDPQALLILDPRWTSEASAVVANKLLDLLLNAPTYRARKALLRRGTTSRPAPV
jgi:hypothetical protein